MDTILDEPYTNTPVLSLAETLEETMERLMTLHGDSLTRLCFMLLGDSALAEDAVSETFFKAYPRFRHESSEQTWLSRIAVNTCRSLRARAWFRYEDRRVNPDEMFYEAHRDSLPDDTVLKAVMALKPRYREPILLHYYQNLAVKEIALALGIAVSTVSVRLMRAREQLSSQLKEWYFNE